MKRVARWQARVGDALRVLGHQLANLFRGRAVHVVFTGTDRDTLNALVEIVRRSIPEWRLSAAPLAAAETEDAFRKLVSSWALSDINDVAGIQSTVGRYRDIVVVAATADPRDSVCSRGPRPPHQFLDSAEYSIEPVQLSLTAPGVLPRFEALDLLRTHESVTLLEITRDELHNSTRVIEKILGVVPRSGNERSRSVDSGPLSFESWAAINDTVDRVAGQLALHPELDARAVQEGYPPASSVVSPTRLRRSVTRGTVIAFHTPDEVYRKEAARLKSTLDALELAYRFVEVTPHENWVRTTLSKPSWIIGLREEISGPLLYIDVDALVHEDPWPVLSNVNADVAGHVTPRGEFTSGTVLINDTDGARRLLHRWRELAEARRDADSGELEATGENGDQGLLKQAVVESEENGGSEFSFERLPVNLTFIFDRVDTTYLRGPVIIEHLQASRESSGHEKRLARRRERLRELQNKP